MTQRSLRFAAGMSLCAGFFVLALAPSLEAGTKDAEAKKLTEELKKSKDPKVRAEKIEEIGKLAQINKKLGEGALPEITQALEDKDEGVRKAAALAYGRCDPDHSDSVQKLTKLLKDDKDMGVRKNAALGLGSMGEKAKSAVPTMRQVMQENTKDKKPNDLARTLRQVMQSINGTKK